MLKRIVEIDGLFYDTHELCKVIIRPTEEIQCHVKSYNENDSASVLRVFSIPFSVVININDVENQLWMMKAFEEYYEPGSEIDFLLGILTDEQAISVINYFYNWEQGKSYHVGDRVKFVDTLYRCLQDHYSQAGWEPPVAVSLWTKVIAGSGDTILPWQQPDSTNPYMKGDKVTHAGKIWVCDIDNNVWEPGVYGWVQFLD